MMSEYICEELIVEIFTRLQIEVILRFRTLSKSIRSCIDGPHFIRKHTLLSPQKFLIRHQNSSWEGYTLHSEDQLSLHNQYFDATALKFPFSHYNEIVGSCNGILCLYDSCTRSISLWNPCIRRKLTIPDRPRSKCKLPDMHIGFGYDPVNRDYKILRISYDNNDHGAGPPQAFIYSVRKDAWCHIDSSPSPLTTRVIMSQACSCLNGTLHWVVQNSVSWPKLEDEKYNAYIMTFDLTTHVFGSIELPAAAPDDDYQNKLTIINGCIAVFSDKGPNSKVWVRRRLVDKNTTAASWHLEFDELKLRHYGVVKFVGLTKNGNFLFLATEGQCVAYNHESSIQYSSFWKYGFNSVDMQMCVESLELLDTALPYKQYTISYYP